MNKETLQDLFSEMLTRKIDEPWEKPWFSPFNKNSALTNFKTGYQYKNGNFFMLLITSMFSGFKTLQFMTFKQGLSLGYMVNKGSEGIPIYYYNFSYYKIVDGKRQNLPENPYSTWTTKQLNEAKINKQPFIKIHHVFNVSQFSNMQTGSNLEAELNSKLLDILEEKGKINRNPEELLSGCEDILKNWVCPINLVKGSDRCFYSPVEDYIQLAEREQFKDNESFYATSMHEITHSTGHDSRTGRINKFYETIENRKEAYAIEELVAELASAFIMAANNFAPEHQKVNSCKYVQIWKDRIKNDDNLAFKVCNEAYKAISYIAERFPETVPYFNFKAEAQAEAEHERLEAA